MLRRLFVVTLVASASASAADTPPRPHVLFIAVDDLKPTIGAYRDPVARTPNIDRLAARGLLFENAYCNHAVCAASRNTLVCSRSISGTRPAVTS